MAENSIHDFSYQVIHYGKRVEYVCPACGMITSRKATELPPETCWLCGAVMFERPAPEE